MRMKFLVTALATMVAVAAWAGPREVPDEATIEAAVEQLHKLYETEYAKRTSEDRAQLSRVLFHEARRTRDDPVGRYALLSEARDLAALAGDADYAFTVMQHMSGAYDVDLVDMSIQVLPTLSRAVGRPEEHRLFVERAMLAIEAAIDASRYEDVQRLLPIIRSSAIKSRDRMLAERINEKTAWLNRLRVEYAKLAEARRTLEQTPDDPAANLAIGLFHAYTEGDWDKALPHLLKSGDAAWAKLADRDLASPGDAAMQKQLGDDYWALAEQATANEARAALYTRARLWYRLALPNLSGLTRKVVAERAAGDDTIALGQVRLLPGLLGVYYNDYRYQNPAATVIDSTLTHNWGERHPHRGVAPDFAARWYGWLKAPQSGWYVLSVYAAHKVRIDIEQQTVLEGSHHNKARVYLIKGFTPLEVQYENHRREAVLSVRWQPPGAAELREIPAEAFYHDLTQTPEAHAGNERTP